MHRMSSSSDALSHISRHFQKRVAEQIFSIQADADPFVLPQLGLWGLADREFEFRAGALIIELRTRKRCLRRGLCHLGC
jgi:hypothetical protein